MDTATRPRSIRVSGRVTRNVTDGVPTGIAGTGRTVPLKLAHPCRSAGTMLAANILNTLRSLTGCTRQSISANRVRRT